MDCIDEKDKVINRIFQDIANYVKQTASSESITIDDSLDSADAILTYFRTKNKKFLNKERQVAISQELENKMSSLNFADKDGNVVDEQEGKRICDLINGFVEKFQSGEDVTNHSSKTIFSSNEDYILNNWNLRHLHLSDEETAVDKIAMSSNRSSWLLFYILTEDDVDFVDVVFHPTGAGFTAYRFLEIIQQNGWMEKCGFMERKDIVPGSLKPEVNKDDDIYMLYKNHLNVAFTLNGTAYCSFGVSSAGYSFYDTFYLNRFKKKLRQILGENKYVGFIGYNNGEYKLVFEDVDGNRFPIGCQL